MLTFLFEFVVFSVALIFACMCHCQLHAFVASLLLQWLSRIRESLSPNTMAAASAVAVGGGDEDMSSVSGDSSGESAFSQSTMLTGSVKRVKKKLLKKKEKKKAHSGPRTCYACKCTTDDDDILIEHHRRMQEQAGAAGVPLPKLKMRWGKRKANGKPDGDRCYLCYRTVRSKVRWAEMKPKVFKAAMETDKRVREDFLDDQQCTMAVLVCIGVKADVQEHHVQSAAELWQEEAAGEEFSREGKCMLESKFKELYNDEERKKLPWKLDTRWNLVKRCEETIVRVFDDDEGIERFKNYQRKGVVKRTRLADVATDPAELDKFFAKVAETIGRPTNTKGYLTAADLRFYNMEREALSKAEKKKKVLKKNDSVDSSHSSSAAPLAAVTGIKKEKVKGKAKAKAKAAAQSSQIMAKVEPQGFGSSSSASLSTASLSGSALSPCVSLCLRE